MSRKISRKKALQYLGASTALAGISPAVFATDMKRLKAIKPKEGVNHSVCRWCYNNIPLETLCEAAQDIGLHSIELLHYEEWKLVQKYNLTCAMAYGSTLGLTEGFNNPDNHDRLKKEYLEAIPKAADSGLKNIICFSGNRNGLTEEEGLENCAIGLAPVIKEAQKYNLNIVMELLNSKVNHPDYQCDRTEWGVALTDKMGADNFKLLYDIYHMQIMEGDVIATIRKYKDYIAHYHTGGVPGRHEIDESQELYYPAIVRAIKETGFDGFIAQE